MTDSHPRRVCVVLVDRANYGRLKPVMQAIDDHDALELQVACAGTMVLRRFDEPVKVVERDGFRVDSRIFMELEGSTPLTMAKSVGFGVVEFASELHRLEPDMVVIIGDRYEALGAAVAAAYMNLPIVHVQGGEVSGSIDESARHAISKFAQYHVPATARAADFLVRMGERPDTVLAVGCPSSDLARQLDRRLAPATVNQRGSGPAIDVDEPFLLVVFHPTTTAFGGAAHEMETLLAALEDVRLPTLLLWPNIDAGSDQISKTVRVFRDQHHVDWLRTLTNLQPLDYLRVLAGARCAVGNSSSFVRDAGFFGTPVVLVGARQQFRERDEHVSAVDVVRSEIVDALRRQVEHGPYSPSTLYGDGEVSRRVADKLASLELYVQKHLGYVEPH